MHILPHQLRQAPKDQPESELTVWFKIEIYEKNGRRKIKVVKILFAGPPGITVPKVIRDRDISLIFRNFLGGFVITSYSIHYTKLYDFTPPEINEAILVDTAALVKSMAKHFWNRLAENEMISEELRHYLQEDNPATLITE